MLKALKYFILENCIDIFFSRLTLNLSEPNQEMIRIVEKIYDIIKKVRHNQGMEIVSFEEFCREELMIVSHTVSPLQTLKLQLLNLQIKYPIYA